MKYYICEGEPDGKFNASTKARLDANEILGNNDFKPLFVKTKYAVQKNRIKKIFQLKDYALNLNKWLELVHFLSADDIVVIQYPLLNTTTGFDFFLKKCQSKNIKTIALVHDLDSLRFSPENDGKMVCKRVSKEDRKYLKEFSLIISHNHEMSKELESKNVLKKRIINLGIFDYLVKNQFEKKERKKDDPIIIAGNLSSSKAKYLEFLSEIKNTSFNLYGIGYEKKNFSSNINYKGSYLPEELLKNMEGSFGLVWDGVSKDACEGGYGNYLKYNNPHKASSYLAAGIPLIVWDKSAIADFVLNNKIGIAISSLNDINDIIFNLSENEYNLMCNNCKDISLKLYRGDFLSTALKKCLETL